LPAVTPGPTPSTALPYGPHAPTIRASAPPLRDQPPSASGALLLTLTGHTNVVYSVAWSPGGSLLASAGDQTTRLWATTSRNARATLTGHTGYVRSVAWSPDGRHVASASRDQTVRLWDTTSGKPLATLIGQTDWVQAVAWSPDSRRLASTSSDQTVCLW